MVFPSVMTWVYFVAVAGEGEGRSTAVALAYGVGKVVQFAFPAAYVGLTERQSLRPALPNRQGLAFGLGFGLAVALLAWLVYFAVLKPYGLMRDTPDKVLAKLREQGLDSTAGFVAVAVFYSVVHALLEEYYWRWFVFGWLKRHLRPWPAIVLAAAGFMAHHVIVLAVFFPGVKKFFTLALPCALGVGIGGGVWCWAYHKTGSLYAAWVSHALIDAAVMVIGYDLIGDRLD
jgi:membrane protease YdiL (CAAX protease family)